MDDLHSKQQFELLKKKSDLKYSTMLQNNETSFSFILLVFHDFKYVSVTGKQHLTSGVILVNMKQ